MTIRMALALALSLLIGAGTAQAQMAQRGPGVQIEKYFKEMGLPKEFSVNMEMQAGGMTMASKMAVKEDKTRMEMTGGPMGPMIVIHDGPAKKNYMVFTSSKTYMEMPAPPQQQAQADGKAEEAKVAIKELGEEQKEGHLCTKRLITITEAAQDRPLEMTIWNAKDMQNLPVRIETSAPNGGTMAMVYKDYDLKSPADSLFQVPEGYKKQMGFGGMMPPQQRAADVSDDK